MSGGKSKDKAPHQMDTRGKRKVLIPVAVLESEAYRHLSLRARAVLTLLLTRFNFYNNNHPSPRRRLMISAREIAHGLNNQNHRANSEAVAELVEHGFIEVAMDYPPQSRMAREYRITFAWSGDESALVRPTNEYLDWRPAGRKKGKKLVEGGSTERCVSVAAPATERKVAVEGGATEEGRFPQKCVNRSVEPVATLGSYQVEGRKDARFKGARSRHGAPAQPIGTTEASWALAGIRAAENPAAPSPDEMRDRTIVFLAKSERGTQSLLSRESGIPEGTLSKFINHEGPLAPRACIDLACAIARLEAWAEKGRAA